MYQLAYAPSRDVVGMFWLTGLADRPEWFDDAVCAEVDPEAFFPEQGQTVTAAKKICAGCGIAAECLEYSIANDIRYGVWGGQSERQRTPMRRARREALKRAQLGELEELAVATQ